VFGESNQMYVYEEVVQVVDAFLFFIPRTRRRITGIRLIISFNPQVATGTAAAAIAYFAGIDSEV